MTPIRVVLADRHTLVHVAIRHLLEGAPDLALVTATQHAAEALRLTRSHTPDVLLLGMNLPFSRSLEVARQLLEEQVSTRILAIGDSEGRSQVYEMLACRVAGYLSKADPPETIVDAIRGVGQGQLGWLSLNVITSLKEPADMEIGATRVPLTKREREVLGFLAVGYRGKDIADVLNISADTVKNHVTHIYEKLQIHSRAEAIAWAWRHGLMKL